MTRAQPRRAMGGERNPRSPRVADLGRAIQASTGSARARDSNQMHQRWSASKRRMRPTTRKDAWKTIGFGLISRAATGAESRRPDRSYVA